ncbi:thiamine-phosphate diphosphorylase [Bernardetia litoralis DSM 6794]|uniref:Thiamine-phosphate synthase n=1 Tax=Bernardetia litoralis (strain ATCC 23117 / DSM 6794 / NBRC 15988 / NCIMB 1366 / Fx l1 / Sio-4) TaxID=880071 RepID=I4AFE1_BERLS|nr:thiamine phosphate synthase [Bernardetia litoralis]AFM02676.1 thiamine-phosphate diphosphorylase [Bernardetia litoralis DSM 6794]
MNQIDYSLMYVTDDRITDDSLFFYILEASLKGGASIVQLREKKIDTKNFFHRALKVKSLCEKYKVPCIINDRVDIALAVNADGIHLGQKDMPHSIARKLLGKDKIIGLSVSNTQQAIDANTMDVDYIGISPIFGTTTKTKDLDKPLGIKGLKEIKQNSLKPIICIGGINKENTTEIIQNGSNGIAVVSAISKAENAEIETKILKNIICQAGTKK